jgi:hypothetical protein
VDFRSPVLLAIAIVVPLYLIVTRRDQALLAWICLVVCIDIFSPTVVVNWSAARIVGLLILPRMALFLKETLRTRAGRALILQYLWLVLLGIVFGFLVPWDDGFYRSVTQTAQGRAVVQFVRLASDLSIALFVASWVTRTQRPDIVVKYVLWGAGITSLFAIVQFMTRVDIYYAITGLRSLEEQFGDRVRGLNYEPRGLGLIAGTGLLLVFVSWGHLRRSLRLLAVGLTLVWALLLTTSVSAVVVLLAGSAALFFYERRIRKWILVTTGCLLLVVSLVLLFPTPQYFADYADSASYRLSTEKYYMSPSSLLEEFALRLEVFDTSALLFLYDNPLYIVTGTGPGLISIPATQYAPLGPRTFLSEEDRTPMVALPTMGSILELSNGGLLLVFLWLIYILSTLRSFHYLIQITGRQSWPWRVGRATFLVGLAVYIVQASPLSAIWSVFVGIGLSASVVTQKMRSQPERVLVQPTPALAQAIRGRAGTR